MINPYSNEEKSLKGIASAEKFCRIASTVVGAAGAFIFGRSMVMPYLPANSAIGEYVGFAAGAVMALFIGWLTDMMFGTWLQKVSFDLLASSHPNVIKWSGPAYFKRMRTALSIAFIGLLIGLFVFDMSLTITIADPIANQRNADPLINVDSIRSALLAEHNAEIKSLSDASAARDRAAKNAANTVAANNANLSRLASGGNGWAKSKLTKQQAAASAADNKSRAAIEAQLANVRTSGTDFIETRTQQILSQNALTAQRNEADRIAISSTYKWCSWVPKVASIVMRIMLVMAFLAYSYTHTPDLNGDGLIDYNDVEAYLAKSKAKSHSQRTTAHQSTAYSGDTDFT